MPGAAAAVGERRTRGVSLKLQQSPPKKKPRTLVNADDCKENKKTPQQDDEDEPVDLSATRGIFEMKAMKEFIERNTQCGDCNGDVTAGVLLPT